MAAERRTLADLLRWATQRLRESGSETPRLDAEVLLGHVVQMDRASVIAHPEMNVGPTRAAEFEEAVRRRETGEPVAYVRGLKEFYGIVLAVDRRVLIPRAETELLVDLALARIGDRLTSAPRPAGTPPLVIVDVGAGSGAIAVSVAVECRRRGYAGEVRLVASDISDDALDVARENAVAHGVADLFDFAVADLLDGLPAGTFDVVLANLPYIPSELMEDLPVAATFEPPLALDGGRDGLDVVRRLLDQLPGRLAGDGVALAEIGSDQADALGAEAEHRLSGWAITIHKDLAGLPRVAELHRA
ncbi:MAG: peptide chain release factor N(5)-glutamine methyltransferase [Chloroflexota bacterium]|nr:peptide chain release factor N(5)-glutamine methyltransferase [Chloroflexota bacterium]